MSPGASRFVELPLRDPLRDLEESASNCEVLAKASSSQDAKNVDASPGRDALDALIEVRPLHESRCTGSDDLLPQIRISRIEQRLNDLTRAEATLDLE